MPGASPYYLGYWGLVSLKPSSDRRIMAPRKKTLFKNELFDQELILNNLFVKICFTPKLKHSDGLKMVS